MPEVALRTRGSRLFPTQVIQRAKRIIKYDRSKCAETIARFAEVFSITPEQAMAVLFGEVNLSFKKGDISFNWPAEKTRGNSDDE